MRPYLIELALINQLTSQSATLWGKMDAAQMLAHCQVPLKEAFGEAKLQRTVFGISLRNC